MLKRKIINKMETWRAKGTNKCLVISGARQVGKTYAVRIFGEQYESFIELNFLEKPELKRIFDGSLNGDTIVAGILLGIPGARIVSGKTLILLDEIQECPNAITALKFLAEDARFDVIATGSALGMAYNRVTSYPVGSVEYFDMTALDFEEFLDAMEVDSNVLKIVRRHFDERTEVEPFIHEKMMSYLMQYMAIGGMPEVVDAFVNGEGYAEADAIQKRIYRDYLADIARFAPPNEKIKAENCYKTIPMQLSKENHKFQYKIVEDKGTSRKFESSIDWLENAHMVIPVTNVAFVEYPLDAHEIDNNVRIYPSDIGMLIAAYDYSIKNALVYDRLETISPNIVLRTVKGGLYEALIADMLTKAGHRKLHFIRNDTGTVELEFFIEGKDGVIPIEVKAGKSKTRTLDNILNKENIAYGYKLSSQNVGISGKKITLPLYMAMFV